MRISIIAAVAENGVIGRGGQLPWRLADDLRRFKQLTMGHTVIMGRKTWESIGRPLPGRRMVVISRQADYRPAGAEAVQSLETALELAATTNDDEVFVIGGAEIYRLALPRAERLYLTRVHANVDGDAVFPDFELRAWKLIEIEERPADASNEFSFSFEQLEPRFSRSIDHQGTKDTEKATERRLGSRQPFVTLW